MVRNSPGEDWESKHPEELGMSSEKLQKAESWLQESVRGEPYRAVVVRHGYIAAEWNHGFDSSEKIRQASAGMVVLLVQLHVLSQVVDAVGHQRHLHLHGTAVVLVKAVLAYDGRPLLARRDHSTCTPNGFQAQCLDFFLFLLFRFIGEAYTVNERPRQHLIGA